MDNRLLLLFFGLFGLAVSQECPPGVTASEDQQRCFHLMPFAADFVLADQICKQIGGSLVTIPNDEDNQSVQALIATQRTADASISQVWIGGTKMPAYGEWIWSSGESFNYTNGLSAQTALGINCLSLRDDGNGTIWVATECCVKQPFVCETAARKELVCPEPPECPVCPTAPATSTSASDRSTWFWPESTFGATASATTGRPSQCKTGWSKFGNFTYCAIQRKSWKEGEAICKDEGGQLVSIHSDAENVFVSSLAEKGAFDKRIWLGARWSTTQFVWIDESPFDYRHWSVDGSIRGKGVVSMRANGLWDNQLHEETELTVVCKRVEAHAEPECPPCPTGPIYPKESTAVAEQSTYYWTQDFRTTAVEPVQRCDSAFWSFFEGYCYLWVDERIFQNGEHPEQQCIYYGAELTSIHNEEENTFVRRMVDLKWLDGSWVNFNKWTRSSPSGHKFFYMDNTGMWDGTDVEDSPYIKFVSVCKKKAIW